MSSVPKKKTDNILYYKNHIQQWLDNGASIGVAAADVTALQALVTTAEASLNAQILAKQASKDAVATCTQDIAAMNLKGMELIKQIRAKAGAVGDTVYPLAGLPVPAAPAPVPAPGKPNSFAISLAEDGTLELTWKCTNPRHSVGVIYQIYRQDGGVGEFNYLGGSGQKRWIDTTLKAGVNPVTYQVQATRSTSLGAVAQFNVNFGAGSTGTMTASITTAPKLVA